MNAGFCIEEAISSHRLRSASISGGPSRRLYRGSLSLSATDVPTVSDLMVGAVDEKINKIYMNKEGPLKVRELEPRCLG